MPRESLHDLRIRTNTNRFQKQEKNVWMCKCVAPKFLIFIIIIIINISVNIKNINRAMKRTIISGKMQKIKKKRNRTRDKLYYKIVACLRRRNGSHASVWRNLSFSFYISHLKYFGIFKRKKNVSCIYSPFFNYVYESNHCLKFLVSIDLLTKAYKHSWIYALYDFILWFIYGFLWNSVKIKKNVVRLLFHSIEIQISMKDNGSDGFNEYSLFISYIISY